MRFDLVGQTADSMLLVCHYRSAAAFTYTYILLVLLLYSVLKTNTCRSFCEGYPEAWVKAAEKKLKGAKVESLERDTPEGIKLKPVYCAADLERCEAVADADRNAPGLLPYHRSVFVCTLCTATSTAAAVHQVPVVRVALAIPGISIFHYSYMQYMGNEIGACV